MEIPDLGARSGAPSFLDLGRTGRAAIWRYLLGIGVFGLTAYVLAAVPVLLVIIAALHTGIASTFDLATLSTGDTLVDFVILNAAFPMMWVGILLAVRLVHGRPFRSVVTAAPSVRWRRIGYGAAAWLGVATVATAADLVLHPNLYRIAVEPRTWFLLLPLALLLTPIQATAEELQFRGYLLQMAGRLVRRPWPAALTTAVLFTVVHAGNAEFWADPSVGWIPYFAYALVWVAATIRDDGMELAIGAHAANNLFGFLLVDEAGSTARVGALLTRIENDPTGGAIGAVVMAAAFWIVVFGLPTDLRAFSRRRGHAHRRTWSAPHRA
jgi:CAAX protease family protein